MVSIAAGAAAVVFAFIYRKTQVSEVRAIIVGLQPDAVDETIDMVTQVVFFVSVIAVLLIVLTELALVRRMMSRHGGARWALALVLIPHAATAAIAESFLTFGNEGVLIAVLIILEGLLAVLGLGVSFLPAANRWFRRRKSEGVEAIARPNV